ncbi:MAG: preprotein translocase subunit SecG, partial [Fuerstiella sp.]|nr:preprotein translocase subunit SecG [Fuerstiella sp.]
MIFLKALFIVVLVLSCLMLIGLVLLQKSKSEGLGMAFGAGAGESLFGARAGNVLSKATVVIGIVFMACCLVLGVLFAQKDATLMDSANTAPAQPAAVQPAPIEGIDFGAETAPAVAPVAETAPV